MPMQKIQQQKRGRKFHSQTKTVAVCTCEKKSEKRLRRSLNQSALEDLAFEALYCVGWGRSTYAYWLAMLTNGTQ